MCGAGTPARQLSPPDPLIAVSCHSAEEVIQAAAQAATFAVFAPVFEKKDVPGTEPAGLTALHQACEANIPVLALGGITLANARSCLAAGAAGIAAIRLFQENNIAAVVQRLRTNP
jgi:thiamine-phosphate pyrophosphorylase